MTDNGNDASSLVLLGCGKMGSALLAGWLARGRPPNTVWVVDPIPSDWVKDQGVHVNDALPTHPNIVVVAVKPQMMSAALPNMAAMGGGGTLFVSVAAGTTLDTYEAILGSGTPIVRAMPNTPAAIGQGIAALIGNAHVAPDQLAQAESLLAAVGETVLLENEDQMDAVTAVSGSGPAYVFHLIETMSAAGVAEGLPPDLAMKLAQATVAGAGALAQQAAESPDQLRVNVTSPNGTTQAALEVLMQDATGFPKIVAEAVAAAARRSRELSRDG
ncbi:MAG: pyrroline-5-carboxylate reductase [Pseudomonadota bacterium]